MGVLGSQIQRNSYLVESVSLGEFLENAVELAEKHDIDVGTVVAVKSALEAERRNNLLLQVGKYRDEQAAGFGDIFATIATILDHYDQLR